MNKIQLTLAALLTGASAQSLKAIDLKVVNDTTFPVNVFVRGSGSEKYILDENLHSNAGQVLSFSQDNLSSQSTFQVLVSKNNVHSPEWSLVSGSCENLSSTRNHTILIKSDGFGIQTICAAVD